MKTTVYDSFVNVLTKIGIAGSDKRTGGVAVGAVQRTFQELDNLYSNDDIAKRLINLPAQTMTRKWLELSGVPDGAVANDVMKAGHDLGIQPLTRRGIAWGRLYGSALMLLDVDDGQSWDKPVDESRINKVEPIAVIDRWDLRIEQTTDELGKDFGEPELYRVLSSAKTNVTGQMTTIPFLAEPVIHRSRVLRFDGDPDTPRRRQRELQGWNESVLTPVYEVVRDYQLAYGGYASAMQSFGAVIYKIAGLGKMLAEDKDSLVLKRIAQITNAMSSAVPVPLDKEEDLEMLSINLSGSKDGLQQWDQRLAAAIGWPVTVLMGRSPAGMNATGESDLVLFYDAMEGEQRNYTAKMETFYRYLMLAKSGPTRGVLPDGWFIKWNKLWQESQGEQAKTRELTAKTDDLNIANGIYSADEAASSHYGGEEFSIDVQLDMDARETDKIDPADNIPGVDLRGSDREPDEAKPSDQAMTGGQIASMQAVLEAFNAGKLTREQAIAMFEITFGLEIQKASMLVGPELETVKPAPGVDPAAAPPTPTPTIPPNPPPPPPATSTTERVATDGGALIYSADGLEWVDDQDRQAAVTQTLILSKSRFKTSSAARAWLERNGFAHSKIDETETSFRFRQREPGDFKPGSMRTIQLTKGVSAVIGRAK